MKTLLHPISISYRLFYVELILALLSFSSVKAATYYARANGNWNINTTWSLTSGGPAAGLGVWPVSGDTVFISEGAIACIVTIPALYTANCAVIYMGALSATAANITFDASSSGLYVSGDVIIFGPNNTATRAINVNEGIMAIGGVLELGAGQTGTDENRSCRVVLTTGNVTVNGNLVFLNVPGSSPNQTYLDMSGGACTFNLAGAFMIFNSSGTLNAGTASTFNFNGLASGQTVPIGISSIVYNNININNTHSTGASLSAAVTAMNVTGNISVQSGTFNNEGNAITLAAGQSFSVSNDAIFNLTGTSTMVNISGGGTKTFSATSTVNYAGTDQSVSPETYGHLAINGSGMKIMPASISLFGNWTNNGTVDAATNSGAVIFCGFAGPQSIGGYNSTSFFDLVLNNLAGVALGNSEIVTNNLTLTSGILLTGANTLTVSNTAVTAISGATSASYINGNLCRSIAAGANTYMFPIGTASAYASVSMAFAAETTAGSLSGNTTDGDHGSIGTSAINPSKSVNRTWTFSIISGLTTAHYDATFNWAGTDQDPGFSYIQAICGKYAGSTWYYPVIGTMTPSSAQITGVSGFSDFQVGNSGWPRTFAPIAFGCAGNLIDIPVKVNSFFDVAAISLTLVYDKSVMTYDSYSDDFGLIDYVYADESGTNGIVRISGISETGNSLDDYAVLITLKFNYIGGYTDLTWDDSDDTWCEYAGGPPDFNPYPDNPASFYYVNGSVTDASLHAGFIADNLFPPTFTDVQLTDLSTGGATSWLWSFDRPGDVVYTDGSSTSQNPKVQFTHGGLFTVTLKVYNEHCDKTEVKTGYIRAGIPGVWTGDTSTDWYTMANWDDHLVPAATINVLIPTIPITTNYYPHLLGDLTIGTDCKSITLTGTAELTVDGLFTVSPGTSLDIKDSGKVTSGY